MQEKHGNQMSKQEKLAVFGLIMLSLFTLYLLWILFFVTATDDAFPRSVSRSHFWFFYAFLAGNMLISYVGKSPLSDERDKQITAKAFQFSYFTLAALLLAMAAVLGVDGLQPFLHSRSSGWLEMFIIMCVMFSLMVNCAVRVICYWRDRR